ncbi:MAG: DNA mismatch repair protein MutL [Verrucomicrobia bacterium]|nr:DNA mismatch repair protein MutL [Verrucomicrobiota bacterium]
MSSKANIRVLPVHVANKIAAGEVVDRPASIVKELVENAIDAGATQVDVEITAGGRKLVAVSDNGAGMNRDDAILSVERHATSKIHDVDDIEHISTLGFRGEALAAIASVSRFRLVTCSAGETVGTEILIVGGKMHDVRDTGTPKGTSIEVRDIFFNVPARRKFLRTYETELSHVRDEFIIQALAHCTVGMTLKVDGRKTYTLAANSELPDRLRDLFGTSYRKSLREVGHKSGEVGVSGLVSIPVATRSDRNEQYVFVNGRPTSAPLISHAIREGYRSLIPGDRFPSVFLFIELDSSLVDVNVHPTKKEVRFRHPGDVRDAVIAALRKALVTKSEDLVRFSGKEQPDVPAATVATETQLVIENLPPTRVFNYPRMALPAAGGSRAPGGGPQAPQAQPAGSEAQPQQGKQNAPWSWCRVLGQIGSLYVLMETEDGLVVMDPHAAHERVLFEKYLHNFVTGRMETQTLLMPETVELMPRDAVRVRKNLDLLKKMGFGISEFGTDTFVVDALPSCFAGAAPSSLLNEAAHNLEEAGARGGKERSREEAIAQAACKSAVKARDKLSLDEIERLVVELGKAEMPYTCPHGRPTVVFMSFSEINRKFGRE